MGLKGMVTGVLLTGLFIIAMINFGVNLAADNNTNQSITDDPRISNTLVNLTGTLGDVQSKSEAQKDSFQQDEPTIGESILLTSVPSIVKNVISMMTGVFKAITVLLFDSIFGFAFVIVFGVIGAIFILSAILFAWEVIKTGRSR